ncbi:MAG: hypothetical protein KF690_11295, partial [Bacteroidetes bacterium]|nr:hypothetical protein [Bacteroidota bacterium]
MTYKQLCREVEAYRLCVQQCEPFLLQESPEACAARKARLQADFGAFCAFYFPHIVQVPLAPFHVEMVQLLAGDPAAFVICQWARGLSKTTTARMAVIWLVCRGQLHFGLLASSSQLKARRLLGELQVELEENRRLQQDYGFRPGRGHWSRADFALRDGPAFRAYGKRQNPRGEQHRSRRPDFIWLDDIDDDQECRNPRRVTESFRWILESLYMAGTPGRTRLLALNNVIAPQSLIVRLAQVEGAVLRRVNIQDEHGQSVWPQKYSLPDIQLMISRLGYRSSQQEYFNNPVLEGSLFRQEHMIWAEITLAPEAVVAYMDPSWSDTGDYKAMVIVARQDDAFYVIDGFCRQCGLEEAVRWAYHAHARWQHLHPRWYLEGNLHQSSLLEGFRREGAAQGWQLPIVADTRQKGQKL